MCQVRYCIRMISIFLHSHIHHILNPYHQVKNYIRMVWYNANVEVYLNLCECKKIHKDIEGYRLCECKRYTLFYHTNVKHVLAIHKNT